MSLRLDIHNSEILPQLQIKDYFTKLEECIKQTEAIV